MRKNSFFKRLRRIRFIHKETGEIIELDTSEEVLLEKRVKRLRRRLNEWWDYLQQLLASKTVTEVMITLTYEDLEKFQKGDLSYFLQKLRKYCKYHEIKLYAYFWVLEFQKRGVPHYHILLIFDRVRFKKLPFPDKFRTWWRKGLTRIEFVRKNARNYLSKYISKCDYLELLKTEKFKKVRLFGYFISFTIQKPDLKFFLYRLTKLPEWLRFEVFEHYLFWIDKIGDFFRYIPRYIVRRGWCSDFIEQEFFFKSPFTIEFEYEGC